MGKRRPKFQKERPPDPHAVGTDWRLFLAVPMPAAAQALAGRLTAAFAEHGWPVRWVAGEAAHVTLHFLGETPPERAELLRMALGPAVAKHAAFRLQTGDLGLFPDERQPRVLWLGLRGQTGALERLHRDLGTLLGALEFPVEARRFHPHITLGRVRDQVPPRFGAEVRRAYDNPAVVELVRAEAAEIAVNEVLLVRSYLERGGARHVPIGVYPLARA